MDLYEYLKEDNTTELFAQATKKMEEMWQAFVAKSEFLQSLNLKVNDKQFNKSDNGGPATPVIYKVSGDYNGKPLTFDFVFEPHILSSDPKHLATYLKGAVSNLVVGGVKSRKRTNIGLVFSDPKKTDAYPEETKKAILAVAAGSGEGSTASKAKQKYLELAKDAGRQGDKEMADFWNSKAEEIS